MMTWLIPRICFGTSLFQIDVDIDMEEKELKVYYASFVAVDGNGEVDDSFSPDGEYFECYDNEEAISIAQGMAEDGVDYSDVGHVDLELLCVERCDPDNEYEVIEEVWC